MRKYFFIICFLLLSYSLTAATDSLRLGYSAKGTVVDAVTGGALESVLVSIPGRSHSTVTNADGFFIIKSDTPFEKVSFSHLGYHSEKLKAGGTMKVSLRPENLQLDAASIVMGDPEKIVWTAIDNIWYTYCTQPELLECFYRETLQKRRRYTYVAEAVARIYKSRFSGGGTSRDAAALEKSRLLVSQRSQDTLSIKTQGGPTMAIHMDLLKNTGILFTRSEMSQYEFQMLMPKYIGDRLQFVIKMSPRVIADYALYNCTLYIDRELLTFTRIEASVDMTDPVKATRMMLVKKPGSLRFTPLECSIVVNYRLEGNHSRLEYLRTTMRFLCDWRKRLFKTDYTAINELVVTDVLPEATPIDRTQRFRTVDCLNDKAIEFTDPDFWADYNIIEPSETLEHAINRLRRSARKN